MMTRKEKQRIQMLRKFGFSYPQVARLMDINVSTIKSYCRRYGFADTDLETSGFCKMCRTPITQSPHRKKKEFCGNNCRVKWFYHKKKLVTELEAELNENFDDD